MQAGQILRREAIPEGPLNIWITVLETARQGFRAAGVEREALLFALNFCAMHFEYRNG